MSKYGRRDNMEQAQADKTSADKTGIGVFVVVLGIIAGLLFLIGGFQLYSHGQNLVSLQSQATQNGDNPSIMEVYYNEVGYCNQDYALAAFGAGVSVIALSVGLGAFLMKKPFSQLLSEYGIQFGTKGGPRRMT